MRTTFVAALLAAPATAGATSPDDDPPPEDHPSWRSSYDWESIEAYSIQLYGSGMMARAEEYGLHAAPLSRELQPLAGKNPRFNSREYIGGAGLRFTAQSNHGFRFGLGMGWFHLTEMELLHDELAPGLTATLSRPLMLNYELSIGKAFDATHFYPYLDAKFALNVITTHIDLSDANLGHLGSEEYHALSFTLAPRLGAFVPIDGDWFVDVGAQYGAFGIESAGFYVGLGTWDD